MKSEKTKFMSIIDTKAIQGYDPVYYISKDGLIYRDNHKMSPANNGTGYYQIKLRKNKKRYTKYVHVLVWETFVGKIPKGYEINHIDHDKSNNSLSNLELVTHSQNIHKAVLYHGYFGSMNRPKNMSTPSQAKSTLLEGVETTGEV